MGAGTIAFTSAHYRMWITQFLVATVFHWTSNLFWSFAVVELFCAWLGVLGLSILGQQLGLSRRATVVGMLAFIFSPILTSYMWRNQLHVAAIGSMAFGAGMACLGIKARRPWWERSVLLAGVWWTTSLFYQYHWAIAPLTLAAAHSGRSDRRERLFAWMGAAVGFGLLTVALQAFAAMNGIPVGNEGNDPRYPLDGLVARLRSPDLAAMTAQLVTRTKTFAQVFHPVVMLLALVGVALGPPRARVCLTSLLVVAAGFLFMMDLDRVAHVAYPAVYLGVGSAVVTIPRLIALAGQGLGVSPQREHTLTQIALVGTLLLLLTAIAHTNSDLWRDYRYIWSLQG